MNDARRRIPVEDAYVAALGRATYTFARAEWGIVWCHEKLQPGYIPNLGRRTAGKIADDYLKAIGSLTDASKQAKLLPSAQSFQRLVKVRNEIMHGKPGTAPDGTQGLFGKSAFWSIPALEAAADEFASCDIEVNKVFYGVLGGP